MTFRMYESVAFALCGFVYLFLILIMYLSKKKVWNVQTKVFTVLLLSGIGLTLSEFLYVYGLSVMDKNPLLTAITCRIYTVGILVLVNTFIYYMLTLFHKNEDEEKTRKHNRRMLLILFIISFIITCVSMLFPLEYKSSKTGFYNFGGPGTIIVYANGFLLAAVVIIVMAIKKMLISSRKQRVTYFVLEIIAVVLLAPQLFFDYDLNTVSFLAAFMISTLYFTMENQDNKLVQELQTSKEEAEIADKAKTEFLINMSHEIRSPMSTILGYSEILLNEEPLTESVAKRDAENIYAASNVLIQSINTILDISEIENDKETIKEEKYNINTLVFEIEEETMAKVNSDTSYQTITSNSVPKSLIGDTEKIRKILNYIINYFIIATPSGKITLSVNSKITEANKCQIFFTINSTNCHISSEKFDVEFSDFVNLKEDSNTIGTTDLKLIVAKKYISLLKGKIDFENENGNCNCTILIPQRIEENASSISSINREEKQVSRKTILIADENRVNHIIIGKFLEDYGFNIMNSYSKEDANNKIRFEKIDLILIETAFLNEDLEHILKDKIDSCAIVEMNENHVLKTKEYVNDIIYKPISHEAIQKVVNRYIEEKEVK